MKRWFCDHPSKCGEGLLVKNVNFYSQTGYLYRWPDIFPKETLPKDILPTGQLDERTFRGKDILPKRQLAGNREILGVVTWTAYNWLLNRTSQSYNQFINLMTETLIVK